MMTSEESSPYAVDEVKTYIDEGDENDEKKKSEVLSEDKKDLVGNSEEEEENSLKKEENSNNPFLPGANAFQLYSSFLSSGLHSQLTQFNQNLSMYNKDRFPMPMGAFPPYGLPPSAHSGLFPFYPDMSRWAALTRFSTFPGAMSGSPLFPGSPGPSFIPIPGLTPPSSSPKPPPHMTDTNFDGHLRGQMFNHHNGLLTTDHQFFRNASFSHQKPSPKKPAIKKPLNSFMLFMKEKRSEVIAQTSVKESAAINQVLGRQWHALGKEGQQKYYDMAKKEKELHAQKYPGWSARDNYALNSKKKKKKNQNLDCMDDNMSTDSDSSRANRMTLTPKSCKSLEVLMPDIKAT